MKKIVNYMRNMDKTKKLVICFIIASFVFIIGFSCFRQATQEPLKKEVIQTNVDEDNQEKEDNQEQDNQQEEIQNDSIEESRRIDNEKIEVNDQSGDESRQIDMNQEPVNDKSESNQESGEIDSVKETITVNVQVIGMNNDVLMDETRDFENGSTPYSVLKILAKEKGIRILTSGYGSMIYIRGIGDYVEKEHGSGSGWVYMINGNSPQIGAGAYPLKDGDLLVWEYIYSE